MITLIAGEGLTSFDRQGKSRTGVGNPVRRTRQRLLDKLPASVLMIVRAGALPQEA
ncbi:MAG TPA: hypothetical protein VF981_05995 [Gemmatimonadaceae bacterium]